MCINHANTTWKDFRREDGGTYHVVRYDKDTGAVVDKNQLQGDTKESTWSRGHAWLVYGLVVCYRFTHDKLWLDRAEVAADYFIRNLNPDSREKSYYNRKADMMLSALCSPSYFVGNTSSCLLAHSVRYYHVKDWNQEPNIDEPCIFADYYFLEALYRYKTLRQE